MVTQAAHQCCVMGSSDENGAQAESRAALMLQHQPREAGRDVEQVLRAGDIRRMHDLQGGGTQRGDDIVRTWHPLLPPTVSSTAGETPSVGAVMTVARKSDTLICNVLSITSELVHCAAWMYIQGLLELQMSDSRTAVAH